MGVLESSGRRLTVDAARARGVLFKNQFPEPAMYLLKVVQAMVRAGCQELRFWQSPETLELQALFPGGSPFKLEQVNAALVGDPLSLEDPALRHLAVGLGAPWFRFRS